MCPQGALWFASAGTGAATSHPHACCRWLPSARLCAWFRVRSCGPLGTSARAPLPGATPTPAPVQPAELMAFAASGCQAALPWRRVCYTRGLRACTSHVRYMHDALSTCVYMRTICVHTWCYVRCVRCACVVCYGYDVRAVPVRRVACVVQYVVCTTHI